MNTKIVFPFLILCVVIAACSKPESVNKAEKKSPLDTLDSAARMAMIDSGAMKPPPVPPDLQKPPDPSGWPAFDAYFKQLYKAYEHTTTGDMKFQGDDLAQLDALVNAMQNDPAKPTRDPMVTQTLKDMQNLLGHTKQDKKRPVSPGMAPPRDANVVGPLVGMTIGMTDYLAPDVRIQYSVRLDNMSQAINTILSAQKDPSQPDGGGGPAGQGGGPPPPPGGGNPPPPPPPPPGTGGR